jgi:phage shock protein PspC (stress-responsive transcriptional regulator)
MIHDNKIGQALGRFSLLGVCATAAGRSGLPPLAVRAAAVIAACLWFKLTVALYCAAALAYRLRR